MNETKIKELLNLLNDFIKKHKDESDKLPYHFNVIDELHANENAHSRILLQLFKYKEGTVHIFLNSFLMYP